MEIVEGMVKSVVRLVLNKYYDVPVELLKIVDSKVGESVTKIDDLVPPVINQISSEAISAAQRAAGGVATDVQLAGVVNNASGFINQVSSEAISTAQKAPGVGESVTKIDRLVPPAIKQVSSEAISAAQKAPGVAGGVATEVQNAGVMSTASGFIEQASSEAISATQKAAGVAGNVATEVQQAGVTFTNPAASVMAQGHSNFLQVAAETIKEEEQRLKYLAFVQVAAVHAVLCFTNLLVYVKERSGPFKPGVEIVDEMFKSMVRMVLNKYFNVPVELLKFVDTKVGESVTKIEGPVPPVIKQVSSEAISAAQMTAGVVGGVATEVQRAGVETTASGFIKQVSSEAISAAQETPEVGESVTKIDRLVPPVIKPGPSKAILATQMAVGVARGVATEVQRAGAVSNASGFLKQVGESVTKIDHLVSPVINQVSSEAISADQKAPGVDGGVAIEVQRAGVMSAASGFIEQVSPEALLAVQKASEAGESVTKIDHLVPVVINQVSSEAISAAQKAAGVASELQRAGVVSAASELLEQVSSEAISTGQVAPRMAWGVATEVQRAGVVDTSSGFIKPVSSEVISAAQKAPGLARNKATEVQHAGLVSTASGYAKSAAKGLYAKYEPKAEEYAVSAWHKLNRIPLFPQVASIVVPTASYFTDKYNKTVVSSAKKGYKVASYLPLVPTEKIAKVFSEDKPESVPHLSKSLFV
ncbi:uncharacterized protein LOC111296626 [Durio zibethinus]|uniref:Uncharacterized protein LOC111296626 n=1 Tax=Durio zibethinus TaxID=66656 RepID=A0A6P5Z2G7_DURZI|nr:uncharacterized protein LOC111296626 [Durio zibethinus]